MPAKPVPALAGRTVRCLLFDFGDTLWTRVDQAQWYSLERKANQQAVTLLRKRVAADDLPTLDDGTLGDEVRKVVERQIRDFKRQNPEYEPDFASTALRGLQQLGIVGIDKHLSREVYEALYVPIEPSRKLFPDVPSTLAALRERGFLLGVVTNRHWGGKPFSEELRTMGLLNYFSLDHIAVSADLGVRKPNPAIFLPLLHKLGVSPLEAAMVGDSLSADVAGARRLNIFAIWKPKHRLFAEVRALRRAGHMPAQTSVQQEVYALEKLNLNTQDTEQPLNLESADDNYLLDYARSRASKRKKYLQPDMKPDLTIEHISDLLDIFAKAGQQ